MILPEYDDNMSPYKERHLGNVDRIVATAEHEWQNDRHIIEQGKLIIMIHYNEQASTCDNCKQKHDIAELYGVKCLLN